MGHVLQNMDMYVQWGDVYGCMAWVACICCRWLGWFAARSIQRSFDVRHLAAMVEGHMAGFPIGVPCLFSEGVRLHVILHHLRKLGTWQRRPTSLSCLPHSESAKALRPTLMRCIL